MRPEASLILLGDQYQLASVESGAVLGGDYNLSRMRSTSTQHQEV